MTDPASLSHHPSFWRDFFFPEKKKKLSVVSSRLQEAPSFTPSPPLPPCSLSPLLSISLPPHSRLGIVGSPVLPNSHVSGKASLSSPLPILFILLGPRSSPSPLICQGSDPQMLSLLGMLLTPGWHHRPACLPPGPAPACSLAFPLEAPVS